MAGDICAEGTAHPQMKHSVGALQLGNLPFFICSTHFCKKWSRTEWAQSTSLFAYICSVVLTGYTARLTRLQFGVADSSWFSADSSWFRGKTETSSSLLRLIVLSILIFSSFFSVPTWCQLQHLIECKRNHHSWIELFYPHWLKSS